jgi:hypothetical protein
MQKYKKTTLILLVTVFTVLCVYAATAPKQISAKEVQLSNGKWLHTGAPCGNTWLCPGHDTKIGGCVHTPGGGGSDKGRPTGGGGRGSQPPPPPTIVSVDTVNPRFQTDKGAVSSFDYCTPGVDCPNDDLDTIKQANVNPAFAHEGGTCPLYWVPGDPAANSVIVCTLTTGNTTPVTLPDGSSSKNTYMIFIGKHTLTCVRKTTEVITEIGTEQATYSDGSVVVTNPNKVMATRTNEYKHSQSQVVECKQVPGVVEI